ncbi:hypothetical protein SAMD00019534_026550, partial [Acytostelium subglobosum LB1]|uniref:hypothetical protein n=1 Tax=Acytostelium subglobosum LB1 TaxID=1410327 RepID=UPI0006448F98
MARRYEPNHRSYLNGRLITGPDKMYFISAILLMFIPEIPFLVTVCPLFVEYVTAAIYPISIFLWLVSFVYLFITSYTDPGIVPRGVYNDQENPFASDHRQPLYKTIVIREIQHEVKWCETCSLYRPPRANHCGICNSCIEHFDHHCPWVGNCIGRRNYKFFMYFLITLGFKCCFIIGFCIAHIVISAHRVREDHPMYSSASVFGHALNASHYLSIILIVYALGGLMFVGSLGGFHCFLIATGRTTNEKLKRSFKKGNPFNLGIIKNFIHVFFAPHYPSYYRHYKLKERELVSLPSNQTAAAAAAGGSGSAIGTGNTNNNSSSGSSSSNRMNSPMDPTSPV